MCHDKPLSTTPGCVEEQDGCFVVRDSNGPALSNLYFEDESKRHLLTRYEAQHIARNLAKLPERLTQA